MKFLKVLCICLMLMSTLSCTTTWWGKDYEVPPKPDQISAPNFKENVYEHTKDINANTAKLDVNNDRLLILIEQLKVASTEGESKEIVKEINSILNSNVNNIENLKKSIKPLVDIAYQLNYLQRYVKQIEKQNNEVLAENTSLRDALKVEKDKVYTLKSEEQEWYKKLWVGLAGLGVIGIVVGVITCKFSPKTGMSLIGASLLFISLAYFAQKYAWVLAFIGGFGLFVFIGVFVYTTFIHKKAIREQAGTVEKLKFGNWDEVKNEVKHSTSTDDLVNEGKKYLKKKGII